MPAAIMRGSQATAAENAGYYRTTLDAVNEYATAEGGVKRFAQKIRRRISADFCRLPRKIGEI
ncbi:MAG: hypothetical protein IBGAMO2_840004 [Arenicellales bacterium IbO2]|nr:MAG: hypothetical protein IBGAMO2_840004 [Arenicellales bacterium IbO2]